MSFSNAPRAVIFRTELALALLLLILAACTPTATPAAQSPTQPLAPPAATELPTPQSTQPPPLETTAELLAVPPTQPAVQPLIDNEFRPSDPAQVNLAAGQPQLIEFFAFW